MVRRHGLGEQAAADVEARQEAAGDVVVGPRQRYIHPQVIQRRPGDELLHVGRDVVATTRTPGEEGLQRRRVAGQELLEQSGVAFADELLQRVRVFAGQVVLKHGRIAAEILSESRAAVGQVGRKCRGVGGNVLGQHGRAARQILGQRRRVSVEVALKDSPVGGEILRQRGG